MEESQYLNHQTDNNQQGVTNHLDRKAESIGKIKPDCLCDMVEYLWAHILKLEKENRELKREREEYQNSERHKAAMNESVAMGQANEIEASVFGEPLPMFDESSYDASEMMCPVSFMHEYIESINNILASVVGNIALARLELKKENCSSKYLKQAEKACVRTRQLVSKMANFSSLVDGHQVPFFQVPSMNLNLLSNKDSETRF